MFKAVKITDGHANFFTPLRFLFAYMVLIGHAFVVVRGGSAYEPHIFYQFTMSYIAVNLFFIASGFLVTASMLYRKNMANFLSARILRIFPALIAHVFVILLVFGPLTTTLPLWEYLTHPDTLKQPLSVLTFGDTDMALPGIVPNNSEHIASGALWTLRYEVLAYIGTLLAFTLGLMRARWMLAGQFILFAVALPVALYSGLYDQLPATAQSLLRFGMCYGLGACIYAYRERINFRAWLVPVFFGIAALAHNSVIFEVLLTLAIGYGLFWAAYVKFPRLNFLQSGTDLSYGIYIYHWAVLQGFKHFWADISVWQLILISTPVTIALAALSWYLIEKPALGLKTKFANFLARRKQKSLNV